MIIVLHFFFFISASEKRETIKYFNGNNEKKNGK